MKELIFIQDRKNPENKLHFRLDDSLWEKLFHEIAFLAESGNCSQVRFWNVNEEISVIKENQSRQGRI